MTSETSSAAGYAVPLPPDHPPIRAGRIGVLLMNLGTPEGTSYWPMRAYLKEFLSDRRVIETSRWLWWPLLNLIILTTRPGRKGKDYASIWNKERDEGPLKTITRSQAEQLAARLGPELGERIVFDWAMRYGFPDVKSRLKALLDQGCDRILMVPLYPQYAAPTSATACDQAFRALMTMRWQPAVRVAPPYHDDPAYIKALADSMRASLAKLDFEPDVILCSFHGMPKEYLLKGDPYHCHCAKTWRLFARGAWLQPRALQADLPVALRARRMAAALHRRDGDRAGESRHEIDGDRRAGFSADCLETLEELDVENREFFMHNGGEQFAYLPCLNASAEGIDAIEAVVRRELMGWI